MKKRLNLLSVAGVALLIGAALYDSCSESEQQAQAFREKIEADVPALNEAIKLEAAELLLGWAANAADYASDAKSYRDAVGAMPAYQAYSEVFAPDAGGVYCGGQAAFYKNVLHLFGIDAFVIDFGTLEGGLTHMTVVVPHEGAFYLFDPTFAATFRKDGALVPIGQLLMGDLEGVEIQELSLAKRDFLFSAPGHSFCQTEVMKAGAFYACGIGGASFMSHYFARWAGRLEKAGIPVGVETIPALMKRGFFSIGPALDSDARDRFKQMLADYGIPMK